MRYTSTANIKIDNDTLLHYAALMPNNSDPKKRPPPPQQSSKSARKSNSAKISRPKPVKTKPVVEGQSTPKERTIRTAALDPAATRDIESIIRGLTDTAAMFEKFGCSSGEYWGVVFSNVDGGRIGVAYVGDKLPDIFFLKDNDNDDQADEPPPSKRLRSSRAPA